MGLGLALSRGLTEAMSGTLEPDETPGGGLTMIISLAAAPDGPPATAPGRRERDRSAAAAGSPVTRYGPGIAPARGSPDGTSANGIREGVRGEGAA